MGDAPQRRGSEGFGLELARASFPCSAIVFGLAAQRGALNLALASAVVYAVRPIALPRVFEASVLLAAAILAWGDALSLYARIPYYDLFAHFFVQMLIVPVLYFVLLRTTGTEPSASHAHTFVVAVALGLALGACWEINEWTLDGVLGTNFVKGEADTMTDLIADACGAVAGGVCLNALTVFRLRLLAAAEPRR